MNLRQKLARLDKTLPSPRSKQIRPRKLDHSRLLPGGVCENAFGCYWQNRVEFGLDYQHGRLTMEEFLGNSPEHLYVVAKNQELAQLSLDKLLFIDTETTGLSGGVGTIAFLVGLGYFKKDRFVIRQYFLRRFDEEIPLLKEIFRILERLESAQGAVVSFNGKAYDIPLLFNRAVFHRLYDAPFFFHHIDILYTARRLWKKHLSDCSLSTLESKILHLSRKNDVPGYLIPETYFRYLRSADPRLLLPVFYHNQMDILSMVSLLNVFLQLFANGKPPQSLSVDWLGVGSVYEALGDYERGLTLYSDVLHYDIPDEEKKKALLRLARLHKKNKNYEAAVEAWKEAITYKGFSVEPYEELAKVYEHQLVDLDKAKGYTVRALENLDLLVRINGRGSYRKEKEELMRRLKRLNKKVK